MMMPGPFDPGMMGGWWGVSVLALIWGLVLITLLVWAAFSLAGIRAELREIKEMLRISRPPGG